MSALPAARALRIGDVAPNFTQKSTKGDIEFNTWAGNHWVCLFSHPRAFTPVCTTELGYMAGLEEEFAKRNTKIIALSCDSVEENLGWLGDIAEVGGHAVHYPIICDEDRHVAVQYNMLMEGETSAMPVTVRSVFLISPEKKIMLTLTYPPSTGRNFDEILRVLDSLQITYNRKLATPVNWHKGERCVVPASLSNEETKATYGDFETVKPYLRFVEPGADYPFAK